SHWKLADCYSTASGEVDIFAILHNPARGNQLCVDVLTGFLFRFFGHKNSESSPFSLALASPNHGDWKLLNKGRRGSRAVRASRRDRRRVALTEGRGEIRFAPEARRELP